MKSIKKNSFIITLCLIIIIFLVVLVINIKSTYNSNLENTSTTSTMSNSELAYSTDRADYYTDEQFSNFRLLKGGDLKAVIYRGASPVDNTYNRASITDELLEKNNINYIINLTNSEDAFIAKLKSNNYSSKYTESLYNNNNIFFGNLCINYDTKQYAEQMANALIQIINHEGPFYIHCVHGRDRTGMASIILEALSNASYDEILEDYMKTYENYNFVNEKINPERYNAIFNSRFKNAIYYITKDNNIKKYSSYNYKKAAENFLKFGGLTDNQIEELKSILIQ